MNLLNELRWRPEIGDPSFMGWLTVAAYGIVALLAARVWFKGQDWIWLAVALGMTALCVNKQLDLQSLLTDIGRVAANHLGWYEQRRRLQKWFVLGTLAASVVFSGWFIRRYKGFSGRHKLLTSGVLFLVTFIVIRAISFHHFDSFLKVELAGVRMNRALELGGIFLIGTAALLEKPGEISRK
jgi:hypothetical protein